MADKIAGLLFKISADTKALQQGFTQVQKSTSMMKKQFSALGPIIVGAFSLNAIGGFLKEAIKLSGEAEGVRDAFKKLNDPRLLANLRAATKNTISDLELMRMTVSSANLGLPIEKLGILFGFAAKRAQETGGEVGKLVEQLVLGIGRKSVQRLDDLGLTAERLAKQMGGAKLASASMGEVTAAVSRIAQEEMKKSGGIIDTTKTKTEELQAAWENLKVEIGEKFAPATGKALAFLNQMLDKAFPGIEEMGIQAANEQLSDFTKTLSGLDKETATSKIIEQISKFRTILQGVDSDLAALDDKKLGKWKAFWNPDEKKEQETQIGALEALSTKYSKLINDYRNLLNDVDSLIKKSKEIKGVGLPGLSPAGTISAWSPTADMAGLYKTISEEFPTLTEEYEASVKRINESNEKLKTSFQSTGPFVVNSVETISDAAKTAAEKLEVVNAVIAQSMQDLFMGIGEGLGAIATGGIESLFDNILKLIADFAVKFGSLLIAMGIGREALEKFAATGAPAIVAGIALVALGSAMKGLLAKGPMGGGAVAGGGGYSGGLSAIPITGTTKISGRDIVIAYERGSSYKDATT